MNTKLTHCPICEAGKLRPSSDGEYQFCHGRKSYLVLQQEYSICDNCGTHCYLPGQRESNREKIKSFQDALCEYISPDDVLAVREKYCLSQKDANNIFGGGKQGFSKWERGVTFPAGPTARLLKTALAVPLAMKYLAEKSGITLTHEKVLMPKKENQIVAIYDMVNFETSELSNSEQLTFSENYTIEDEYKYK